MQRLVQVVGHLWTAKLDPSMDVSVQAVTEREAVADVIRADPLGVHAHAHIAGVHDSGVSSVVEVHDPISQVRGRVGTRDEWERMRETIVTMRRDW